MRKNYKTQNNSVVRTSWSNDAGDVWNNKFDILLPYGVKLKKKQNKKKLQKK